MEFTQPPGNIRRRSSTTQEQCQRAPQHCAEVKWCVQGRFYESLICSDLTDLIFIIFIVLFSQNCAHTSQSLW